MAPAAAAEAAEYARTVPSDAPAICGATLVRQSSIRSGCDTAPDDSPQVSRSAARYDTDPAAAAPWLHLDVAPIQRRDSMGRRFQ